MVVTVSDAESLTAGMVGTDPLIIQISGTVELSGMNDVGSNKTIVGLGADAKIVGGGLYLYREKNVIIRNITFQDANEDAIGITTETTNVWIDHCTRRCLRPCRDVRLRRGPGRGRPGAGHAPRRSRAAVMGAVGGPAAAPERQEARSAVAALSARLLAWLDPPPKRRGRPVLR